MAHSSKQTAARERNWLILRLRGAYTVMGTVGSVEGQRLIDLELTKLGAKTCAELREEFNNAMRGDI